MTQNRTSANEPYCIVIPSQTVSMRWRTLYLRSKSSCESPTPRSVCCKKGTRIWRWSSSQDPPFASLGIKHSLSVSNLRNCAVFFAMDCPGLFIHSLCAKLAKLRGSPRCGLSQTLHFGIHSRCVNLRNWAILLTVGCPRFCMLALFLLLRFFNVTLLYSP